MGLPSHKTGSSSKSTLHIPSSITKGRTRPHLTKEQKRKTELCNHMREKGSCHYGDRCTYAHSESELRQRPVNPKYKRDLCKKYHGETYYCSYGTRCSFRHDDAPKEVEDFFKSNRVTFRSSQQVKRLTR